MTRDAVDLLIVVAVVVGVNMLPAFGPPTWALLVYFRFTVTLPLPLLVVSAALAAAGGRCLLALTFRHLAGRLPASRRDALDAMGRALTRSRGGLLASLVFFTVSPLPSNVLFEAAGLARARLGPLLGAFVVGRLGSYTLYLVAAASAESTVRDVIAGGILSVRGLGLGLIGAALIVLMVAVDWVRVIDALRGGLARRRGRPPPASIRAALATTHPDAGRTTHP